MNFPKPRLMRWNNNGITDHNRADVSISIERIENKKRMTNGTLRKYIVADKREFSTSWTMVPGPTNKTVDGLWGADAMENFYNTNPGSFTLELTYDNGDVETFTVMLSNFEKQLRARGATTFWNVSVNMEEV